MTSVRFVGDLPAWVAIALSVVAAIAAIAYYRRESNHVSGVWKWGLPLLRALAIAMVLMTLAGPVLHHRKEIGRLGHVRLLLDQSQSMSTTDSQMTLPRKLKIAQTLGWLPEGQFDWRLSELTQRIAEQRHQLRSGTDADLAGAEKADSKEADASKPDASKPDASKPDANTETANKTDASVDAAAVAQRWLDQVEHLESLIDATQRASLVPDPEGKLAAMRKQFSDKALAPLKQAAQGQSDQPLRSTLLVVAEQWRPIEQFLADAFAKQCQTWLAAQGPTHPSAISLFDQSTRAERVQQGLLDPERGLVARLKDTHHVEIYALAGDTVQSVWNWQSDQPVPESIQPPAVAPSTNLSKGLIADSASVSTTIGEHAPSESSGEREAQGAASSGATSSGATSDGATSSGAAADGATSRDTVPGDASPHVASESAGSGVQMATVVLSDGQHNSGTSPTKLASVASSQNNVIYTIGVGAADEPIDLVLQNVDYPDTVYKSGRVRGALVIKDRLGAGSPFVAQIRHGENVVWQQEYQSLDIAQRRLDFEFAAEPLVKAASEQFDLELQHHAIPLELSAQIVPAAGETQRDNNASTMRINVITQKRSVLLIDGRSRWETRYLKNLYQRDNNWRLNSIIVELGQASGRVPMGTTEGMFPESREALFEYDLVILGDVPISAVGDEQRRWLREFVDQRGGGMILIDGVRGHLRQSDPDGWGVLLPIKAVDGSEPRPVNSLALTSDGARQAAVTLAGSASENERLWTQLPPPHRLITGEPAPGAETWVQAIVDKTAWPLVVARNFGGGRVVYFASDETWRWRYRVEDRFHQRFWNQVARWAMPQPFAVSDQFLSLDSGAPRYNAGDKATLRAQLRGNDSQPIVDASIDALLWRDGKVVATINLAAQENVPGNYHAQSQPLSPGDYRVTIRAAGFNESAFKATTSFVVSPPVNKELDALSVNESLLGDMAQRGKGRYLREEDMGQLAQLLAPLSSGHVVESERLLWQSWPWFFTIVGALGVEWFVRKRKGLL